MSSHLYFYSGDLSIWDYLCSYGILDKELNVEAKTSWVGVPVHATLEKCYLFQTGQAMDADGGGGVDS